MLTSTTRRLAHSGMLPGRRRRATRARWCRWTRNDGKFYRRGENRRFWLRRAPVQKVPIKVHVVQRLCFKLLTKNYFTARAWRGPAGGGERTPGGVVRRVPQPQMGPPFWPENVMQSSVLVLCCKLLAILHANVIFASHSLLDALGPSRSTRANPRHARCPLYSQPMIPLYTGIIAT